MDKPRPSAKLSFIALAVFLTILQFVQPSEAQVKKVRVAIPGYTIAVLSFLAAKANGYYASEGLDVELVAMRGPTANVAVLSGSVEFSAVLWRV
jgi:ABC-type nitrate/sulfonate/bicarbonate transport system substrate-binding protein